MRTKKIIICIILSLVSILYSEDCVGVSGHERAQLNCTGDQDPFGKYMAGGYTQDIIEYLDYMHPPSGKYRLLSNSFVAVGGYGNQTYIYIDVQYMIMSSSTCDECYSYQFRPVSIYGQSYMPNIPGCAGYDSNVRNITGVECYELGSENPLKPKTPNYPVTNGIYVKLIYHFDRGPDSSYVSIVSGGCQNVTLNGDTLHSGNARDYCIDTVIDGVPQQLCSCLYRNRMYSGSCEQNGIDTSCGGQVPFDYTSNNDSIINQCRFNDEDNNNDSINPIEPDPNDTSRDVSQDNFTEGMNRLIQIESESNTELKGIKSYLKSIYMTLVSFAQNTITSLNNISSGIDSLHSDLNGSDTSLSDEINNGVDTSLTENGTYDTSDIMNKVRGYLSDSIRMGDTNISSIDTNDVNELFSQFNLNIDTSNCDCNPEWFEVDFMGTPITLDICQYPIIRDTVKVVVDILSIFFLSIISFKALFKTIRDLFI